MIITIKPKSKKEQTRIKAILKATEIEFVEEIHDEDWWDEISEAEKESIELGLKDIEEDRMVSESDFLKTYGR